MKTKLKNIVLISILFIVVSISSASADDYYVYANFNPANTGNIYSSGQGVGGYATAPNEGILYVASGNRYADVYKVSIPSGSDPNMHPDNPDATGPMAQRTIVRLQRYDLTKDIGSNIYQSISEFVVDDKFIYYGPSTGGIHKWVKNADGTFGTYLGKIVSVSLYAQTLAFDGTTFYAGAVSPDRNIYSFTPGVDSAWKFEFTYPSLAGGHHDGLEWANGYLWVSDMTSDKIAQYEKVGGAWNKKNEYSYSNAEDVEGMGFGPLGHLWATGWTNLYELGGGKLQTALEGIPDQCAPSGQSFTTIDLDSYATGAQPFSWTYSGASSLTVNIGAGNIATITYPSGWTGSETITFTVTDNNGVSASTDATFTVEPVPVVGDIPDQTTPFTPINLDSYLSGPIASTVTWTASGNVNLAVYIDPVTHIATVSNPLNSNNPETITFTATATCCNNPVNDSDSAIFTPNRPPVAEAGGPYTVNEGSPVTLDASGSTDPDGDVLTYAWDLNNDGTYETPGETATITPTDGPATLTVGLQVSDGKGGTSTDTATVTVNNVVPTVTIADSYKVTVPVTLRIAGQGMVGNSVALEVIQDGNVIATNKIIRTPGSPNQQEVTISATVDLSKPYSGRLKFDTEQAYSGGTPVWVIIDGVMTKVTTFNTQKSDPSSYHQTYDFALSGLVSVIGKEISFTGSATDPGADDMTFDWLFGDGGSASKLYPWPNSHSVTETVKHTYSAAGSYTVKLDVTDDDGGVGSANKAIVIS